MTLTESPQNGWTDCEPGSLGRYAERAQSHILYRRITKVVGIATVCLFAVFACTAFWPQLKTLNEPNYGGIRCSKVKSSSMSYLAGTLDKKTNSKIELHLRKCTKCLSWINQIRNAEVNKVSQKAYRVRYVSMSLWQAPVR